MQALQKVGLADDRANAKCASCNPDVFGKCLDTYAAFGSLLACIKPSELLMPLNIEIVRLQRVCLMGVLNPRMGIRTYKTQAWIQNARQLF